MSSTCGDEGFPPQWDDQGSSAHEEKIYVSIRVRPLNDTEVSKNDVADWECINDNTILFKNGLGERSSTPTAYQFDRVFGCECSTRQVYDEAAKSVFLSVLSGINASIFAYGQTSSGKTYTMSGVTKYAVQDIYEHIHKHDERNFVLKFSAIEIYNEVVRDLLSSDNTGLRLLDDPERGTVVEKLSEVTLRDQSHLNELLTLCDAQRQIGETSLNGMSSRSHQILRLTVESSAKQYSRSQNNSTLSAAVNFIDLAGSERASQTQSAGTRLKEGCHINRSLLTLGTVIRKLSKGRNGHIPFRDSKLTRILQNSLGGNARTAIICTMSPARSHVEQSRNTLLFATCAKQVATKAQVNVVMSDKALVRQLQKELARLENELKALKSRSVDETSALVLKEKEDVIEKMNKEMRELMMQRDIAQSRMQNLLHSRTSWGEISYQSEDNTDASEASETPFHHHHHHHTAEASASSRFDDAVVDEAAIDEDQFLSNDTSPRLFIDKFFGPDPCQELPRSPPAHRSDNSFASDSCCKEVQCIETGDDSRIAAAKVDRGGYDPVYFDEIAISAESKKFAASDNDDFLDVIVKEHKFKISMDEDDGGVTVPEDVGAMPEKQFRRGSEDPGEGDGDGSKWPEEFEKKRGEIVELWDSCHVPLVHRTCFFLLFKGDPSDAVYMEVELRRLQFLKNSWSQGQRLRKDGQNSTEAASIKAMKREKEMLCKQMVQIFNTNERNRLFQEWGIGLNTKQRRLQLCDKLWKDSKDMEHLQRSASLVAKLVGFVETNDDDSKAMFGLNFAPHQPLNHFRSYSWTAPRMPFMT